MARPSRDLGSGAVVVFIHTTLTARRLTTPKPGVVGYRRTKNEVVTVKKNGHYLEKIRVTRE
jgi:hypothetical protein